MMASESDRDEEPRHRSIVWAAAVLLPALAFVLLYARSLPYEFVWTDRTELEQGLVIRPPGGILHAFAEPMYRATAATPDGAVQPYYRPLKVVVASVVDREFGREARAFRAVNIALGAATFAVFALLFGGILNDPRAAGLVALVAAVHPAGIEDHVWPSGLDGALAKFFTVACLAATVRAASRTRVGSATAWGSLSLVLLVLGLGSKELALVTPGLALVCLLAASGTDRPRALRTSVALVVAQGFVVLAYFLLLRPLVLGGFAAAATPIYGRYAVHLLTVLATWPDRIAWLFLPLSSTTSDVASVVMIVLQPSVVLGLVLAASVPFVCFRLWRSGHRGEALGWAWIWIAFLPTSGLVPLSHVRAERHLALPALGAAMFALTFVRLAAARVSDARMRQLVAAAVSLLIVGGLAQRTFARLPDWRSDITLFGRDVARDPFYREGRFVLAAALSRDGRPEEAREQLLELAAVNDRFGMRSSFVRQEGASRLLCEVDLELGLAEETVRLLGRFLRPDSPVLAASPAFFLCGARSLEQVGKNSEAHELYRALHGLPQIGSDPRVILGLARVNASLGNRAAARSWLNRTPEELPADPRYAEDRRRLGELLGER